MEKPFNFKRAAFIIGYTALTIFLSTKASEKTWLFVLIWAIWFGITAIMVMTEGAEDGEIIVKSKPLKRICPRCNKKTIQTQFLSKPLVETKGDYWQCNECGEILDLIE